MKRNFLITSLLILCFLGSSKAQYTGKRFLSGTAGINFNQTNNERDQSVNGYGYNFDIALGNFKTETKAVGWRLSNSLGGGKNYYTTVENGVPLAQAKMGINSVTFGAGRFWQFYKHFNEHIGIFGGPSVDASFGNSKTYSSGSSLMEQKSNTIGIALNLSAGVYYRLSEKWWATASLAFGNPIFVNYKFNTQQTIGSDVKNESNEIGYQLSPSFTFPSVGLGLRYFYNR